MDSLREWLVALPKAELHLHLEGAIPQPALWELIQQYGGDPGVPTREALAERFRYRDFPHFIETWVWQSGFLRSYADFTFIAAAVARSLAEQQIYYVEAFYSPSDFARHGLKLQPLTEAIRCGLNQVPEVEVKLVMDLVRDRGPQSGASQLAELAEVRDQGVVGIGIGGSEHDFPPEVFRRVYQQARTYGFRTSAHAGEAAGPASIWGAVRTLRADRIGHGTRAIEDPQLVEYLAEHQIPIELCPISNVCTAIIPNLAAHPIRQFVAAGMLVSINTDDPAMFGNSLVDEYAALVEQFGFTQDDIRQFILNAIDSSWMPAERKQRYRERYTAHPAWAASVSPI